MTAAEIPPAVGSPGRVPPGAARANRLHISVSCLGPCGPLDSGYTDDPPTNRRYASRWAELEALANKHVADTGHPTRQGGGPEVTR